MTRMSVKSSATDTPVGKTPEWRQIGDRLGTNSWNIDAVLPPNDREMVYEDLPPITATMQGK